MLRPTFHSLRIRLTLSFGILLLAALIGVWLLVDWQIRRAFDQQVRETADQLEEWLGYVYEQIGQQLEEPLQRLRMDAEVLRAVRDGRPGLRPDTSLDVVEYGVPSGRVLFSDSTQREGRVSEYLDLTEPQLIVWGGRLLILRSAFIEAGSERFGYVTGGFFLADRLRRFVPPAGAKLLLHEADGSVRALHGPDLSSSKQALLLQGHEVVLGAETYRIARFPLSGELGHILVAIPRTALDRQRQQLRTGLGYLLGASILATYLAGYLVARSLTRPVETLSEAARRVAAGDLEAEVEVHSQDEIGLLARQFNQMVDDLRRLQEQVVRAERVAVWRDMARMMMHEIKNPLFPIRLSIENLQRAYHRQPEMLGELFDECTNTVLEEVNKLCRIADEFRQFARLPAPERRPCRIQKVIEQVLHGYTSLPHVTIESVLDETVPPLMADPQQLGQVFHNLVKNAVEAMPDEGTLTVSMGWLDSGEVKQSDEQERWIDVTFRDTGIGMEDEVRANLLTPYFTTKETGTGLGMALVERIVHEHGGRLEIESKVGEGSTLSVQLPVSNGEMVRWTG